MLVLAIVSFYGDTATRSRYCALVLPETARIAPYRGYGTKRMGALRKEATVAKDPVCGMEVDPEDAVASVEHEGHTYYFCSQDCADSFREDPESYL
jgi:YHS domain-containing protein